MSFSSHQTESETLFFFKDNSYFHEFRGSLQIQVEHLQ